jgi:hypothetical protein
MVDGLILIGNHRKIETKLGAGSKKDPATRS